MMDEPMKMERETPEPESENESASIFLSKEELGGKTCKKGDTLTLTVTDVDPETGDVQVDITPYKEEQSMGYESDFDKAMPAESEAV